jgi:hypothetical protein
VRTAAGKERMTSSKIIIPIPAKPISLTVLQTGKRPEFELSMKFRPQCQVFQGFTGVLSKILWCVPFLLSFAVKKKPYMYAVKPVNKNYTPPPRLRPVYYA